MACCGLVHHGHIEQASDAIALRSDSRVKSPDIGRDIDSESNVFLRGRRTSEGVGIIRAKT